MILDRILNQSPKKNPNTSNTRIVTPHRVAGVYVDEDTALTLSSVYLSVKIISETIAALPFNFFERTAGNQNKKAVPNHPAKTLMMYPNDEMTGFNFWRVILSHSLLRGNGYAWILRDRSQRAGELQLITPDRVNKGRSRETDGIIYEINNGTGANSYIDDKDMLHLSGLGFDGLTGYSVVAMARRSFAMGISSEQFGASFYENGAQLGTVIQVPPEVDLDVDGRDLLLKSFNDRHSGVSQFHKTAIIDQGMTVETIGIPQKDAQFIESRKFSVTDVARWFNMPPHKLKDLELTTVGNIEEQNIGFVQDTLMPWLVNLEQTINWRLLGVNNNRQYLKYNLNGLLRGDAKSRAEYYKSMHGMGVFSINKILELEDMNGIGSDGDKHFMQSAMTTIDKIIEPPAAPIANPAIPPDQNNNGPVNLQSFRPLIANAVSIPFRRIEDRASAKKLTGQLPADIINVNLNDRQEIIAAPIVDICDAIDVDCCNEIMRYIINACSTYYAKIGAGNDIDNVIDGIVDDVIEICANAINDRG